MPKLYTPPRDSLAAYVVGYFQNNPTEELTLDDIAEKFSVKSRSNIHTELSDAWRADLIRRDTSKDGEVVYTAGNLEFTAAGASTTKKSGRKPGSGRASAKAAPAAAPSLVAIGFPDPAAVVLDDDVPCNTLRGQRIDWLPLLNRMKVGQSAKLPRRCKPTLTKCISEVHKQTTQKFSMQCHKDATELRVWRVA